MENMGTVFPTLVVGTYEAQVNFISMIIQCIAFIIVTCIIIKIVKLYFKNIELKKNPKENKEEIEKNDENIKKTLHLFVKVAGIIFVVVMIAEIILANFYN